MTAAAITATSISAADFRKAMRQLAGGISVITVGRGDERTGLTVTSVSSLSAEPPAIIFCINRSSSSWDVLRQQRVFAGNVLPPSLEAVADRFSGRGGLKGLDRYEGANWSTIATGASVLEGAVAALDCELEETIERHTSAIVIGRVIAVRVKNENDTPEALAYWQGTYAALRR